MRVYNIREDSDGTMITMRIGNELNTYYVVFFSIDFFHTTLTLCLIGAGWLKEAVEFLKTSRICTFCVFLSLSNPIYRKSLGAPLADNWPLDLSTAPLWPRVFRLILWLIYFRLWYLFPKSNVLSVCGTKRGH